MKVIVAGSRDIKNYRLVKDFIDGTITESGIEITEIVSGASEGVDRAGERWAKENNVPIKQFKAKWSMFGKRAGPLRNKEMAQYADAVIAIWDLQSRGTRNMIEEMAVLGKEVFLCPVWNEIDDFRS